MAGRSKKKPLSRRQGLARYLRELEVVDYRLYYIDYFFVCVWLDHDLQCQCCGIRGVFGVEAVRNRCGRICFNVDHFICRLSFL